jgi:1,2-phenylacetyl-CoA epoxidase PaaB subunit
LLEKLHEKAPKHPGLFHYVIHAYDNPVLAEKGIEFAHEYDKLAPNVPHALHMPSHIFVRAGKWDESIAWNKRSAEAALEQSEDKISLHHAHAMDYLMYAYLQQGRDENAAKVLDELNSVGTYESNFATAYAIAAAHARYLLERREWEKAAEFTLDDHSDFPWKDFPQYEAIIWWARGLGAAKSKDFVTAHKAVGELKQLHKQTLNKDEDYWALLVDAQRKTVEAWILYGQDKYNEALALMHEAADQEDSVDKHPVTPGEVLPARELLGDMLLMREKPEKALVPPIKLPWKFLPTALTAFSVQAKRQNWQVKQTWRKPITKNSMKQLYLKKATGLNWWMQFHFLKRNRIESKL